jgi:hypothetical protein
MKKQKIAILIIVATLLTALSCKKETTTNFDDLVGTYVGTIYYTSYFFSNDSIENSGTEDDFFVKIETTNKAGMDLKLSYIFAVDTTIFYLSNVIKDDGAYYFNFPEQLNEEGSLARGNKCYTINGTQYDGEFNVSGGILRFCTKYDIDTPPGVYYGITNEVYTKQ